MDNLPELKNYLKKLMISIIDKVNCTNEKKTNKKIREIQKYITDNLHQPDLSLAGIAKEFYISPSHLSRLFKQEKSQTLVEYITKVRIDKAVSLLRDTDLKVYQVGERVGINDPHYFSIIFKKNIGLSVNDFRKTQYNKE
jgi:two-component system response regulator YesN